MQELMFESGTEPAELAERARRWVVDNVPAAWREAAHRGGAAAIRHVRNRAEYEAWYPVLAEARLVAPTWPVEYGGAGLTPDEARVIEAELAPYNLGRLNPLGLSLTAPALFSFGSEEQRLRFLPPIVRNEEVWCQLFSEPGAGSDLASLGCRAERDGDEWVLTGQKVWNTWAHLADFGVLLARTNPDVPKRRGITYFLVDMHAPGVEVRPLRHITGEVDFNEVFLERRGCPTSIGSARSTPGGRREMPPCPGSAKCFRDRAPAASTGSVAVVPSDWSFKPRGSARPADPGGWEDPLIRQELMRVLAEERIRNWTNQRVRAGVKAGRSPGPESSVGKVHQGSLNQRMQALATRILGAASTAWMPHTAAPGDPSIADAGERYARSLPYEVKGMLRSRANTIEGGTTEVNKNIIAERVLGLPREPDQWADAPWRVVPRS